MKQIHFSVIIPLYNKEQSIRETLQSVLDQEHRNFEVLIVNDGSTDRSFERAQEFNDPRTRFFEQPNGGVSSARNHGIRKAKNNWICFIDADDYWAPFHLSTLAEMIEQYPDENVFCTGYQKINSADITVLTNSLQEKEIRIISDYFKETLKKPFVCTNSICFSLEVLDTVGMFNEKLSWGEDRDLWGRISKSFCFVYSSKVTSFYFADIENSLTSSKGNYNNSIISIIDLSKIDGYELKYYKKELQSRFLKGLLAFHFSEAMLILFKHRWRLIGLEFAIYKLR